MSNKSQLYFIRMPPGGSSNALDYFTANDAVYPAGTPAVPVGVNNHPLVSYPNAADAYVDFPGVLPPSGLLSLDLLWASDVDTGDVLWDVAWERDNPAGVDLNVNSFAASKTVVSAAPAVVGQLRQATLTFTPVETGGVLPGEAYRIRVRRTAGTPPDTLVGAARLFRVILGAL